MESKKVFYFGDFLINEQTTLELADGSSATELSTKGSQVEDAQGDETKDEEGGDDEYKVGDTVIYLRTGKKKEDFDESKEPKDQKKIVGVKKIERIEGDKYYFTNIEGKEFSKSKEDIIKKVEEKAKDVEQETKESLSNEFEIIKFSNFK